MPTAARLIGRLDRGALASAIRAVVQRHDILRTAVELQDERPVQRVRPAVDVPLREIDLRGTSGPALQDALAIEMTAEATTAFDLTRGDLLRVTLLQLDTDDHVLLITTHHIISDAWSLNVLFAELGAAYAGVLGRPGRFRPRVQRRLCVVAAYGRRRCGEAHLEVLEKTAGRWVPATELKTDRPRPPIPSSARRPRPNPHARSDDTA